MPDPAPARSLPPLYAAWSAIGRPDPVVRARLAEIAEAHERLGVGVIADLVAEGALAAERFATLVHGAPGTVARTGSTSEGLIAVARMTPWKPGDTVVLFGGEFPANRTPWLRAAADHGLRVREVPSDTFRDPEQGLAALDAALDGGARMVAVSAVQFHTGLRMPIADIAARAHAAGAQICVDAIQAAGIVPLDVTADGIDWLAVGGHKWLGLPIGTGFLYGAPSAWDGARPTLASWLSHRDPMAFLASPASRPDEGAFQAGPALVEGGMRNHPALAASLPGLDALLARDQAADLAHLQALYDRVEPGLVDAGFTSLRAPLAAGRSGILTLDPPAGVAGAALVDALRAEAVIASCPEGRLRLACGPDVSLSRAHDLVDRVARAAHAALG